MITPQSSCIQPPHIWFPWLSGVARRWRLEPLIRLPEPWFLEGNEHWHGKLMGTSRDRKIKGNREEMMGLTCFFFGAFNGKICKNHVKSSINAGVSIGTLMILMTGGATGLCKAAFPPGTWLPSVPRPLFKRCQNCVSRMVIWGYLRICTSYFQVSKAFSMTWACKICTPLSPFEAALFLAVMACCCITATWITWFTWTQPAAHVDGWYESVIWVWVNTYRYIFSGMNIHLPAILGFTRYQGFDPSPYRD